MSRERREVLADWLIVIGALGLFGSLFLTWSHQFSPAFLTQFGTSDLLRGVPRDPTAWQLYSAVDVVLAVLAGALGVIALVGSRRVRLGALAGAGIGLAFTLHALSVPPTNGANLFSPSLIVPGSVPSSPRAGIGETVATAALTVAIAGLALSLTAD